MTTAQPNFETDVLGECKIVSPFRGIFMDASKRVLFRTDIDELRAQLRAGVDPPTFDLAGRGRGSTSIPPPSGAGSSHVADSALA
jgi:hypothetical protein